MFGVVHGWIITRRFTFEPQPLIRATKSLRTYYLGSLSSNFSSTSQGSVDLSSEQRDGQVDGQVLKGGHVDLILERRSGAEEVELKLWNWNCSVLILTFYSPAHSRLPRAWRAGPWAAPRWPPGRPGGRGSGFRLRSVASWHDLTSETQYIRISPSLLEASQHRS